MTAIANTVTDSSGRPIAGALVSLRDDAGALVANAGGNPVVTDALGRWSMDVADGTYDLTIAKNGEEITREQEVCDLDPDPQTDPITGTVTDEHGRPIAGAAVELRDDDGALTDSDTTDSDGAWEMEGDVGTYALLVRSGARSVSRTQVICGSTPPLGPATWNPADKGSSAILSNGDLTMSANFQSSVRSTTSHNSGKRYAEITIQSNGVILVGIGTASADIENYPGFDADGIGYFNADGEKYRGGVNAAYAASYTTGDVIGIMLDCDAGTVEFSKNGAAQGVAFSTGLAGETLFVMVGSGGTGGTNALCTANFGATAFASLPSGYGPWGS